MKSGLNIIGAIALLAFIGGMAPGLGMVCSILGMVLTTILYAKIDQLGYGTKLLNFSLYQWLIAIIPTGGLMYFGVDAYSSKSHGLFFLLIVVIVALLLFLAFVNYFVAKSLLVLATATDNMWFRLSGVITKIGAYSMPLLVGLLFVVLAQPFFLIGCITYSPLKEVK